ncbi:NUDIX hydrolase [Gleimia hominis]|uniref:NUDIX hydrolase n=1 Tax=Gleimia hominis TaxID=595468 RepID=A0ABU3I9Y5_9ACTO|nr:NUDIX hydrolase [Gleimia hominis]MDT3767190.1 NUDIX hydrolase [Gleimia hominis]
MVNWQSVWKAPDFPLRVESVVAADASGVERTQWRVRNSETANGGGAAVLVAEDTQRVLLVRQYRIRLDRSLWEVPRGMAELSDADPLATAHRELLEETGIDGGKGQFCGLIYPDSGLLATQTGVGLFVVPHEGVHAGETDGEVDDQAWFSKPEIHELINQGELRDAISLAALSAAGVLS